MPWNAKVPDDYPETSLKLLENTLIF